MFGLNWFYPLPSQKMWTPLLFHFEFNMKKNQRIEATFRFRFVPNGMPKLIDGYRQQLVHLITVYRLAAGNRAKEAL